MCKSTCCLGEVGKGGTINACLLLGRFVQTREFGSGGPGLEVQVVRLHCKAGKG